MLSGKNERHRAMLRELVSLVQQEIDVLHKSNGNRPDSYTRNLSSMIPPMSAALELGLTSEFQKEAHKWAGTFGSIYRLVDVECSDSRYDAEKQEVEKSIYQVAMQLYEETRPEMP